MTTTKEQAERRPFRVKARIVSEIGDELISSDAIALYELIKNSFDADATYVRVDLRTPMAAAEVEDALELITDRNAVRRISALSPILTTQEERAVAVDLARAGNATALREFVLTAFRAQSQIRISDDGDGMDRQRLVDGFLSLASTLRFNQQRSRASGRPVLGSKGVGRFSAKRLGRELLVESLATGSTTLEHLQIDWGQYSPDSELYLDQVNNEVWTSRASASRKHGTKLIITDLTRDWTYAALEEIVREQLSTLMNPFFPTDFRVLVRFNDQRIDLHELQEDLLDLARVKIEGWVDPGAEPRMRLRFTPKDPTKRAVTVNADEPAIAKLGDLSRVGPFSFVWYDFVRNDPQIRTLGRTAELSQFLKVWGGGGPLLFRDGFRVMPYGRPGYDWLEIDREVYRSGGIRLRTLAFSGYVAISAQDNPRLIDQTNREGLRATPAQLVFVRALQYAVKLTNNQLKDYWPRPTRATVAPARRAAAARQALDDLADEAIDLGEELAQAAPTSEVRASGREFADKAVALRTAAHAFASLASDRRDAIPAQSYPALLELAGLGMAAEQLSHELLSAIDRAESVLARLRREVVSSDTVLVDQLVANFAALRRISGFLMPLTQASRRTRGDYDVVAEAETVSRHYPAIADGKVKFVESSSNGRLIARVNRGVLLQVFDNLIANSLYWMNAARTSNQVIHVGSEPSAIVTYRDTGPGIEPRLRDSIFEPFVSAKPEGRGLGLFIARELLELERCRIELSDEPDGDGRLREFRLDFSKAAKT